MKLLSSKWKNNWSQEKQMGYPSTAKRKADLTNANIHTFQFLKWIILWLFAQFGRDSSSECDNVTPGHKYWSECAVTKKEHEFVRTCWTDMQWLMNSFLLWEDNTLPICQSKRKKSHGFFSFSLSFFDLSFFPWDAFDIYFSTLSLRFSSQLPTYCIEIWNIKLRFLSKRWCTGRKKSERKSTSLCHSIYRRKCKNYSFSQQKKPFGAWFFPSVTKPSSLRLVELGRVMLAEKLNLKIFFADKGTLTSSTWRLVSCDCMLLERSN